MFNSILSKLCAITTTWKTLNWQQILFFEKTTTDEGEGKIQHEWKAMRMNSPFIVIFLSSFFLCCIILFCLCWRRKSNLVSRCYTFLCKLLCKIKRQRNFMSFFFWNCHSVDIISSFHKSFILTTKGAARVSDKSEERWEWRNKIGTVSVRWRKFDEWSALNCETDWDVSRVSEFSYSWKNILWMFSH